jgi:hypothetical protein
MMARSIDAIAGRDPGLVKGKNPAGRVSADDLGPGPDHAGTGEAKALQGVEDVGVGRFGRDLVNQGDPVIVVIVARRRVEAGGADVNRDDDLGGAGFEMIPMLIFSAVIIE